MKIIMGLLNICQHISISFILFSLRAGFIYQAMLIGNNKLLKLTLKQTTVGDEEL